MKRQPPLVPPLPEPRRPPAVAQPWPSPGADALLDTLPWGVVVLSHQGIVLRLNERAAMWWGQPVGLVQGQPLQQVARTTLPVPVYEALQAAATGKVLPPNEFFMPHSGQWLALASLLQADNVVVYWQDITGQKQREWQYQTLAGNTPDALTRWDRELRLLYANAALEEKMRQPVAALLGKTSREIAVPAASAAPWMQALRRVFDTGQAQDYYGPYPCAPGEAHFFTRLVPELRDGQIDTVLAIARDITALRQADAERLKALQLLQQAEAIADLGSWAYEIRSETFQWSDNMYRLFGLAPGSPATARTYLERVVPEDQPTAERLVAALRAGTSALDETMRIRVGDRLKTLRVIAVLMQDERGHPARILGVNMDVSERQRLEAENLALRLDQQKELLLAILQAQETERKRLAENLHNGLGQLLYATKLQLDQLDTPVLHTLAPPLAEARAHATRLLTEAIVQTRTLAHELVPTSLEKFGLATAMRDICRDFNTPQLHLTCHVWLDEQALPQPLQVALYRLAQELAHNIVKHAQATQATLELETLPGWVMLRAEDNGRGFDPQAAAGGLGLRTLHDTVALLHGTVSITSSPEYGSHLRLRIPIPLSLVS